MAATDAQDAEWPGDVLSRRRYSKFIQTYIQERHEASRKPLTIALDSAWGTGKTVFLTNWATDLSATHGVIFFDAWNHDYAADPMVSFMAAIRASMAELEKRLPVDAAIRANFKQKIASLLQGFSKALVPASAAIVKAALKKATGVAVDEVVDAIEAGTAENLGDIELDGIADAASASVQKGLEVFFKKAMEDHAARSQATAAMKSSLSALVELLSDAKVVEAPLFVLVDELDRCRPDFAIKLLEGMKHLFEIPGVVFVVATNLDQLSKSVQAVYGPAFDGYQYLKRFFDFEFALPTPDNQAFARLLVSESNFLGKRVAIAGLDDRVIQRGDEVSGAFAVISNCFGLDLRSQRQVYLTAAAAVSALPERESVHTLWLFFLAALRHVAPDLFKVATMPGIGHLNADSVWTKHVRDRVFEVRSRAPFASGGGPTQTVSLRHVIDAYVSMSNRPFGDVMRATGQSNIATFLEELKLLILRSNVVTMRVGDNEYAGVARYHSIVSMAGLIRA